MERSAPRVKICGLTNLGDATLAADLGAWALGMIFFPASPRACAVQDAETIGAALRRRAELCGVFVNETPERIAEVADRAGLTMVQLQGDEGPAFCSEVARRTGARVVKAIPMRNAGTLRDLERFHTDFHLIDGHYEGLRGGTGTTFDWSLLTARRSSVPLIASGGLSAENVEAAIGATDPYAVDVSSGVEAEPGRKHPRKLEAFFAAVARSAVAPEPAAAPEHVG